MLLYAALAGPVARMMPASWHWPERRAMHALGEPTMWDAGQRLMQTAAPESWALIVAASPLVDGNREAVQKCREQADKAKKPEIGRAHSELQSLMRNSYAVFCLKKKKKQ